MSLSWGLMNLNRENFNGLYSCFKATGTPLFMANALRARSMSRATLKVALILKSLIIVGCFSSSDRTLLASTTAFANEIIISCNKTSLYSIVFAHLALSSYMMLGMLGLWNSFKDCFYLYANMLGILPVYVKFGISVPSCPCSA